MGADFVDGLVVDLVDVSLMAFAGVVANFVGAVGVSLGVDLVDGSLGADFVADFFAGASLGATVSV